MSDKKSARVVEVYVSGNHFKEIWDSKQSQPWDPNAKLPVGEHFGWDLSDYETKGVGVDKLLVKDADVSVNPKDNEDLHNLIKLGGRELIMMDVGHWGAYHHWLESKDKPQREFGLIENYRIWLCRFDGKNKIADTLKMFTKHGCTRAAKLVEHLEKNIEGCETGIEILSYTGIYDMKFCKKLEKDRFYVIFPDLHLPERWPDVPKSNEIYGKGNKSIDVDRVRRKLHEMFFYCQHKLEWLNNNPVSIPQREQIQKHLDIIKKNTIGNTLPAEPLWRISYVVPDGNKTVPKLVTVAPSMPPVIIQVPKLIKKQADVTPTEFISEKNLIDRYLMCKSTWFYKGIDSLLADPQPAIDLIIFLCAIKKVSDEKGKVTVVQVGDMYELWINREFLYRYFDIVQKKAAANAYAVKLASLSGMEPFQYRMDRNWKDKKGNVHPARRYPFHEWKTNATYHRHALGAQGLEKVSGSSTGHTYTQSEKKAALNQLQDLLKERIDNIYQFTLPMPKKEKNAPFRRLLKEFKSFDKYIRLEPIPSIKPWIDSYGKKEVYWNAIIIDIFNQLNYKPLYGNHDGYRGDSLLNSKIGDKHKCTQGWISEPGIWFEHGHRWDAYNRDGIAFGAAVTNYVYHYRDNLTEGVVPVVQDFLTAPRWAELMPGAALWFTLVNYDYEFRNITGTDLSSSIKQFGIYVIGHTHSADLARMRFYPTTWHKVKKSVRDTVSEIKAFPYRLEKELEQWFLSQMYFY